MNSPVDSSPSTGLDQQGQSNRGKRPLLKWGGIGCGGLLGLFILIGIIGVIASPDSGQEELQSEVVPSCGTLKDAAKDFLTERLSYGRRVVEIHDIKEMSDAEESRVSSFTAEARVACKGVAELDSGFKVDIRFYEYMDWGGEVYPWVQTAADDDWVP